MLNFNKIASDINKRNISLAALSRAIGSPYTSFKDRFERERIYADELEAIANFMGRPIAYYFDREEPEGKPYKTEDKPQAVEEPTYCKLCAEKERVIKSQQATIDAQVELLDKYRKEEKREAGAQAS